MNDGLDRPIISKEMKTRIIGYYKELYDNLEMQSTVEIAEELRINVSTVRKFLATINYGINSEGNFNDVAKIVLLCTKFGVGSPYIQYQRLLHQEIRYRKISKSIRDYNHESEKKKRNGK